MRIIAGEFRGKPLRAPPGDKTRPTSDRARQAVFNILEHAAWCPALEGARALDLFAGSGALGLEALSRGAQFCLFVETDETARGVIRTNIEALGVIGQTRLHRRDATDLGPRPASTGAPFDVVFLDPPYRQGLGERALAELRAGGWLAADSILIFERAAEESPLNVEGYEIINSRSHGAAQTVFLKLA